MKCIDCEKSNKYLTCMIIHNEHAEKQESENISVFFGFWC